MASGRCIDNLPDELLLEIFSNFTIEQLAMTVQCVSRRWKEVSQDNSLWKNRDYSPGETTTDDEVIQHLRNMPMLRKFSPKRGLKNKVIGTMCNTCKNIQQLEFTWSQKVKLHTLKQIFIAFPDLTHLKIPLSGNVGLLNFFTIIGQFKNLIRLSFTQNVETDQKVLTILADGCPSLQHIDLGYCEFVDEDIRYFLEKKKYQLLSFSVQCYISTVTYMTLSECTNLEYLLYDNYNEDLPDTYMYLFSKLSNLKSLSLNNYRQRQTRNLLNTFAKNALSYLTSLRIVWCESLEAQTLNAVLRNCLGLEEFTVYDNSGLNGGFESIGKCSKLRKITLQCTSIVDNSFEHFRAGCQLKELAIEDCYLLTDKAFEYICSGCPLLEQLYIYNMYELTDGIFEYLFKCKNLRSLNIRYNGNITGIHLDEIPTHLVHLELLYINCENLNMENLEKLQRKMPQLEIECPKFSKNDESYSDIDLENVSLFNLL